MAKKSDRGGMDADGMNETSNDTGLGSSVETTVREMLPRVNLKPLMERATAMMQENPGMTLAAAVGTGFVLGVTLFSRVGRMALEGVLGLGAELALQKIKMNYLEQQATA